MKGETGPNALSDTVRNARGVLFVVAGVSFSLNLLMLASPLFSMQLFDRVLPTGHMETLFGLLMILGAALSVLGALEGLRLLILSRLGNWVERVLGPTVLEASVHQTIRGASPGPAMLNDLRQIRQFASSPVLTTLFDAPWTPVFILALTLLHPWFGAVGVVACAILFALAVLNEMMSRASAKNAASLSEQAHGKADAAIRNADAILSMGMLPRFRAQWISLSDDAAAVGDRGSKASAAITGTSKTLRLFLQSGVMALGAYLSLQGELSGGGMIAASILLGRALAPIDQSISGWKSFLQARSSYHRLARTLGDYQAESGNRIRLPDPEGRVSVENVHFRIPGGGTVLNGVSFDVRPGEVLGVIGPSGAGKTTLCRLLTGSLRPGIGAVRLDGSELGHWDSVQLGENVGYMPQDVELFAGTVAENIARFDDGSEDAVVEAAQRAQCHDLIAHFPAGYQTGLRDGGVGLSAGQRQRVGLARAVYGPPRLLVLDEPNANLDEAGEKALWHALKRLKQDRVTVIMVTHRRAALNVCDKVLLLREGKVAEFGPRDEILTTIGKPEPLKAANA